MISPASFSDKGMASNKNTLDTPGAVKKIRTATGTLTRSSDVTTKVTRPARTAAKGR